MRHTRFLQDWLCHDVLLPRMFSQCIRRSYHSVYYHYYRSIGLVTSPHGNVGIAS